jgi:hypothetical protein
VTAHGQTLREVLLHSFTRPKRSEPAGGVIRDSAGNFY